MALTAEKQKVARLLATVRPRESIAHRVAALSAYERELFDRYRREHKQWYVNHETEPGDAFAAMLNGNEPPLLSSYLHRKLFGSEPGIPNDVSISKIAEIWQAFRDEKL